MSYPVYTVPAGDVLPVFFDSFDGGTGASITLTGLAVTDIEIYKDGSATQRASDAGYTLLDTDGIDFDGTTGIHGFSIDTGDNTDAGFYAVGSWYHVVVSSVTVDAQTVNFIAAAFRIMAAEAAAGVPSVNVTAMANNVVTAAAIADGAIDAATFAAGAINAAAIADAAIDAATFAAGAINAAAIANGAIDADTFAASALATIAEIADGVWDEALAGHATAGTAGAALSAATAPSAATVADAVWDEARAGHVGAGSYGEGVNIIAISGDTTAADNCELMFDGTGYAGGTDRLEVNVVEISDDSGAAGNLELACDGTGFNIGGGAIVVDSIAAGGITSSSFAAGAITAGAIANAAIDAATFAADAITENVISTLAAEKICDSVWAEPVPGLYGVGTTGYILGTQGATGTGLSAIPTVAANVTQVSGDSTAADRLEAILDAMPHGAVVDDNDPDPSATAFETNLAEATNDHYNGAFIVFYSGVLLGQSRKISDYDGTTKVLTVATAFTDAPTAADTFIILGRSE